MLSYRLIHGTPTHDLAAEGSRSLDLTGRSRCPHCATTIAWYDLIPVLSWLLLNGRCRTCHQPISSLYPLTELLTALIGTYAYFALPPTYWLGYGLFFSALIVSVRSDLECMLISRLATIYLVPIAFFLSPYNLLPISLTHSVFGALVGYGALWLVATLFTRFTGKQGMGLGDLDLLCFIGAFTGPIGVWISILVGSLTGSGIGLCYLLAQSRAFNTKIPFGPFLALGATLFVFFAPELTTLIIGMPIYLMPE